MGNSLNKQNPLAAGEVKTAFRNDTQFPPILSLKHADDLTQIKQDDGGVIWLGRDEKCQDNKR
jgi:hypothetical protein